jgi:hypothetical protein
MAILWPAEFLEFPYDPDIARLGVLAQFSSFPGSVIENVVKGEGVWV